jgi:hypothetical protein
MINPVSATIDPTDRSIPPVRITKVIPVAIIAILEIWSRIFRKLSDERN